MAQGNRGFADGLTGTPGTRLPPRTGILGARSNRLAELASGHAVTRIHELVDPAQCRIWEGHNRDYAALDPENCADLIESFRAQGRQEVPAIVRRITGDPVHGFEVICGARRHWTAAWLRAHDHPDFRLLVEPRELTDEEAFRVADLENRSRRDLSDYERAWDYARAVGRYYDGSQQRMADRLEVTKSWLSRYLELARLPGEIVAAFGSPHVLGISHVAVLAPLLRTEDSRTRLLREAARVAEAQDRPGATRIPPAIVVRRLVQAARTAAEARQPPRQQEWSVRASDGALIAEGRRSGDQVKITLPRVKAADRMTLLHAVGEIVDRLTGTAPPPKRSRGRVKPV